MSENNNSKAKLVSDRLNTFFTNNKITFGSAIPTEGTYKTGDIIVNTSSTSEEEPMWICNEGGTPGKWGLVGNTSINIVKNYAIMMEQKSLVGNLYYVRNDENWDDEPGFYIVLTVKENEDGVKVPDEVDRINLTDYVTKNELVEEIDTLEEKIDNIFIDGETGYTKLLRLENVVVLDSDATEVEIGITDFDSSTDSLFVFKNALRLIEDVDFSISENNIIVNINTDNWNWEAGDEFCFTVLKNVVVNNGSISTKMVSVQNVVTVNEAVTEVEIGIDGFDNETDTLMVFKNSTHIAEGVEYNINDEGTKIVKIDGSWNEAGESDYGFVFIVFKNVISTDEIDGIDLSGYQTTTDESLATTDKTIVGAINELFQSANNGKEIIADAIGGEVSNTDTFTAMGNKIEDINNTLSTFISNNGGSVTGEESLSELLDILYTVTGISFPIELVYEAKQIACGGNYTFLLKNDGTVYSCGYNNYGQLGLGDSNDRQSFTQVTNNISDVKEIICGGDHTFLIKNDGTLWACGYTGYGQLGFTGSTYLSFTQVTTNVDNIKQLACGYNHTFLLKTDGSVWACGNNNYGQLGLDNNQVFYVRFTQVTNNISDVKEIICGYNHTFLLKNDGTLWACGYNNYGQLGLGDNTNKATFTQVTTNVDNIKQLACGYNHTFLLKTDGSVWACGNNNYGQLGLGDNTNKATFTQVTNNISDVKEIICGGDYTFLLKNDGTLWACGYNNYGQLGLGDNTNKATFTQVTQNIDNINQLCCGGDHIILIKNDGDVWSCGDNEYGQLGITSNSNSNTFTNTGVEII